MRFGQYAVIDEVTHHFEKEPAWWWKIKAATSGNELSISKFLVQGRTEMGVDGMRREYPPTNAEVMHREIALLFAGTNIPTSERSVEEGGDPVLKPGAAPEQVEAVLRMMPHAMVLEIWDAVGDAVIGWGPLRPKKREPQSPIETGEIPILSDGAETPQISSES
jgi:hypothetical protein